MKKVVILEEAEYDTLFRQASNNQTTLREQAMQACDGLIQHLRRMHNEMKPGQIADFLENRRKDFIDKALELPK